MPSSSDGPLQPGHSVEKFFTVVELAANESLVVANQEGIFGTSSVFVISKLFYDPILPVEDNLPNTISAFKNNFDFDDLLVEWEVKAVVVLLVSACSASLPVTQSESESENTVLPPLNLGESKVGNLLQGHPSDTVHIGEHYLASQGFISSQDAVALDDRSDHLSYRWLNFVLGLVFRIF